MIQRQFPVSLEVQDQMNSTGGFQEVESNHSGRLSYVPSLPATLPSSRFMLSRDKRLPLDTWNASGPQENVFGNQFSTFDSSQNQPQGIHPCAPQKRTRISSTSNRDRIFFARDDKQNRGTIPIPTCARRPSTMSSSIPVEFPQNFMFGHQRQQISELQFEKSLNPQSFLVWKTRFKNQSDHLF